MLQWGQAASDVRKAVLISGRGLVFITDVFVALAVPGPQIPKPYKGRSQSSRTQDSVLWREAALSATPPTEAQDSKRRLLVSPYGQTPAFICLLAVLPCPTRWHRFPMSFFFLPLARSAQGLKTGAPREKRKAPQLTPLQPPTALPHLTLQGTLQTLKWDLGTEFLVTRAVVGLVTLKGLWNPGVVGTQHSQNSSTATHGGFHAPPPTTL